MKKQIPFLAAALMIAAACDLSVNGNGFTTPGDNPMQGGGDNADEVYTPETDATVSEYDGSHAQDASDDVPGEDKDIYWEAGSFGKTIYIEYNGTAATVTNAYEDVLSHVSGADVAIDLKTNSVEGVEIVLTGKTDDGQLKVYGSSPVKVTLNGVSLTSAKSSALNFQNGKTLFLHLAEGTENALCDASKQSDEAYYPEGVSSSDEKRNGCIYSKGSIVFSGSGVLELSGMKKHGISAKSSVHIRPGVTLAINDAADNGIKAEGITVDGGYIYALTSGEAGKCLSSDADITINGGTLKLYTTGGSIYDEEEQDTSSPAGAKADGNLYIKGGSILCISTGEGGKGLNTDGSIVLDGGEVNVVTSGGKYIYNAALDLDSSPKGVKADGEITINGGSLNIQVTGLSDGSEGLESKTKITVNDGDVFVYAYDDAINVGGDSPVGIVINGGRIFAFADNNDGIDSNGTLEINGGLVIASGCSAPEEGFDCDNSRNFTVNGGTLVGTGGAAISPSDASKQKSVIYNGLSASYGAMFVITDAEGKTLLMYELPRSMNSMSLFFSSPDIEAGTTCTAYSGGSVSGNTENWNGLFLDGTYTEGTQLKDFTISGNVTTVGTSNGLGSGGPGNGNGGWGPGWWH